MAAKKHPLLANLRKSHAPLAALVHIGMDYILQRPVHELFNSAELSRAIAIGIRKLASEPRNEQLLEKHIHQSIAELQDAEFEGTLSDRTVEAIRGLATQPLGLDDNLITELLNHSAARVLLREVIQLSMVSYSERFAEWVPGGNIVSGFASKFRGFAAVTRTSDGLTLEQHINGSVEENLKPALRTTAEHLADEAFAAELADWRGHVLNVLLDRPVKELICHLDQVAPEELAKQLAELLRSIADWSNLDELIEQSVETALDRAGEQSLGDLLQGAATEKDLRPIVEKQLVKAFWPFVRSSAFEDWLNEFG